MVDLFLRFIVGSIVTGVLTVIGAVSLHAVSTILENIYEVAGWFGIALLVAFVCVSWWVGGYIWTGHV